MVTEFHRAQRHQAKLRLGIDGVAGSGKTYSALQIGFGLGGPLAFIDTEHGSGELYAQLGEYDVSSLSAPFTTEKYVAAIKAAEKAGYRVLIIDSLAHALTGPGGVAGSLEQPAPQFNALLDALQQSRCHIIFTLRSPMEGGNNQAALLKYACQVFLYLEENHIALTVKDQTGLFDGQTVKLTPETGRRLLAWLETGVEAPSRLQPKLTVAGSAGESTGEVQTEQPAAGQGSIADQAALQAEAGSQEPVSQAQIKKMFATARAAGLDEKAFRQLLAEKTGRSSTRTLTKAEAGGVIELLLGLESVRQSTKPAPADLPPRAAAAKRRLF